MCSVDTNILFQGTQISTTVKYCEFVNAKLTAIEYSRIEKWGDSETKSIIKVINSTSDHTSEKTFVFTCLAMVVMAQHNLVLVFYKKNVYVYPIDTSLKNAPRQKVLKIKSDAYDGFQVLDTALILYKNASVQQAFHLPNKLKNTEPVN